MNADKTSDNNSKSKTYFVDIESLVGNALALLISRKGISKIDMQMLDNYEKSVAKFLKQKGYRLIVTDKKSFIKTLEVNFHSTFIQKIRGSKIYIETKSNITSSYLIKKYRANCFDNILLAFICDDSLKALEI